MNGSPFTAHSMYGATPQAPAYGVAAPTQDMAPPTRELAGGWRALLDPDNPLFWFGGILLVTVGAAAAAGSVRLGKATVRVGVGSSG